MPRGLPGQATKLASRAVANEPSRPLVPGTQVPNTECGSRSEQEKERAWRPWGHANCLHASLEPLVLDKGTSCPKAQGSLGMKRYLLPSLEALS